jgi:hypothetical protein
MAAARMGLRKWHVHDVSSVLVMGGVLREESAGRLLLEKTLVQHGAEGGGQQLACFGHIGRRLGMTPRHIAVRAHQQGAGLVDLAYALPAAVGSALPGWPSPPPVDKEDPAHGPHQTTHRRPIR